MTHFKSFQSCFSEKWHLTGLDIFQFIHYNGEANGVWRSLVSRMVRVHEAAGSNPATPTKNAALRLRWEITVFAVISYFFQLLSGFPWKFRKTLRFWLKFENGHPFGWPFHVCVFYSAMRSRSTTVFCVLPLLHFNNTEMSQKPHRRNRPRLCFWANRGRFFMFYHSLWKIGFRFSKVQT